MDHERRTHVQETLVGWAAGALARWAGISAEQSPAPVPLGSEEWLTGYGRVLSESWSPQGRGDRLQPILSLVQRPGGGPAEPVFLEARRLSLDTLLPAGQEVAEDQRQDLRRELWEGFVAEFEELPRDDRRFDLFLHLFCKYAWAVPCSYGEPGVSLYEEFKALAALVHASDGSEKPAEEFLLVGGDIPGIQHFLYTLTSKGAAQGLRGRSFFLQLLSDAVVRALRRELGQLPEANVIHAAGGNFTLLVPAGSQDRLSDWQVTFSRILLEQFEGGLSLALAWEELPRSAVGTHAFSACRDRLGVSLAVAKNRRLAEVVEREGWSAIFEPQGEGGTQFCQVCHREPPPGEELLEEVTATGEAVFQCALCRSFEGLAADIAHPELWMIVTEADKAVKREAGWRGSLARLTGQAYRFVRSLPRAKRSAMVYAVNSTEFSQTGTHAFQFVANVTPRILPEDRRWMQEHYPDLSVPAEESIKDFTLMALQSQGIARVGVLRMDVDNLGLVFGEYLRGSMAHVSALSAAMNLFFAGCLNRVCRDVDAEGEHRNVLYVIYAGGDDLFVVGSWDRVPVLAERIRKDFAAYTGNNPLLTLSGGVTLEGRKFPLYRAAERAGEAEGKAKGHRPQKNAFCFLGQVVGWEEWSLVQETQRTLYRLVRDGVSHGLLRAMQTLHAQSVAASRLALETGREAGRESVPARLVWGRWAWIAAYTLTRIADRCPEQHGEEVRRIQKEWIEAGARIRFLGMASRWAEYRLRGGAE